MRTVTTHAAFKLLVRMALCGGALLAVPLPASAYLDPGTGSILFQSLLAIVFGIGLAFRRLRDLLAHGWSLITRSLRSPGSHKLPDQSPKDSDQ